MFKSIASIALLVVGAATFAPNPGFNARPATNLFTANEVEAKVKGIVAEQLGVDEDQVVPTASITADLGADSLDAVELSMAIEEAFVINIPDEEAAKINTVQDIVDYIHNHDSKAGLAMMQKAAKDLEKLISLQKKPDRVSDERKAGAAFMQTKLKDLEAKDFSENTPETF